MEQFRIKTWFLIISAILALTITLTLHAEEKTFKVSKGGKLKVNLNIGDIKMQTWDKNEVLVKYESSGDPNSDIEITQSGNNININYGGFGSELYSVTLPSEFNAEVKTNAGEIQLKGNLVGRLDGKSMGGDMDIENINGSLDLSTSGGNIKLGFARGTISVKTGGGDMKVGDVDGDLTVRIGGGNITLGKVSKTLKLKTGGGNISIAETLGDANVSTGGGNITIKNTEGKTEITTGGGDIKISTSKGELKAKTSSGRVNIGSALNKVDLTTGAGDVDVTISSGYKGNSELKSSMGSVNLVIPENIKATITAKTKKMGFFDEEDKSTDNIKSDYKALKIEKSDDNEVITVYQVAGGGNNINISTYNGEVVIKKGK